MTPPPEYSVGASRTEITCFIPSHGILGWGKPDHKAHGIESPLHARAFVFEDLKSRRMLVWVCADLCFISAALRHAVFKVLRENQPQQIWREEDLMLTANHTHSAVGGFAGYLVYDLTIPGFSSQVLNIYAQGIAQAIMQAQQNRRPARIHMIQEPFPLDVPVVFNRSLNAYNLNKDVETLAPHEENQGVDRTMTLLRFDAADNGETLGTLNWFGVHATCIKPVNNVISSDNKGYAATEMERQMPVAAFAQTTAGDASPAFRRHAGFKDWKAASPDDFENKRVSGTYQLHHALDLYGKAVGNTALSGGLQSYLHHFDLSATAIDAEFVDGRADLHTGEPCIGTYMIAGTREGPGVPKAVAHLATVVAMLRGEHAPATHGAKYFFANGGQKTMLGSKTLPLLPTWVHPVIREFKAQRQHHATAPWLPTALPVQIFMLGNLAIVALPGEPTTIAGRRIRTAVEPTLRQCGAQTIIIQGYSNDYAGYITTPEEYALQCYEGSHTIFGQWTGPAFQTVARQAAESLRTGQRNNIK